MSYASGAITQETLELAKGAIAKYDALPQAGGLRKAGINVAEGLQGILLEAPAKKLFPVYSPLRNKIARKTAPVGATAVTWRSVRAINTAKFWAGVAESNRKFFNTTTTETKTANFKEFAFDDYVTFRALFQAKGFEDLRALAQLNLLYSGMIGEELEILGGNVVSLGVPAAPSGTATTGGTVGAGSYTVKVSALTMKGLDRLSTGNGDGGTTDPAVVPDGFEAELVGAGETLPSVASGAIVVGGANNAIALTWPDVVGAVAYNIYVKLSTDAAYTFQRRTNINATTLTAYAISAFVPNTADESVSTKDMDGIFKQISTDTSGGNQYVSLNGATLTSDGAAGIVEFDAMLKSMWDAFRLGPTEILVNSEQARDITAKIAGSTPLSLRIVATDGQRDLKGGIYVGSYLNKFASGFAEGFPNDVPIKIHPNMPAGTIIFRVETLPYPNNQVPNVWEIEVLQEYTAYEWALSRGRYEIGLRWQEVLKGYFNSCQGVMKNVAAG